MSRPGKYEDLLRGERLGGGVPNNFFDAMLSARDNALPRDGEDDNAGA